MEDELLDLVDGDDEVIGTVVRDKYYTAADKPAGYLRSAEVLIQNDAGLLWIPRRTMERKILPGALDYSAGGHVAAGEDYVTGCLREMAEELNLSLRPTDLRLLKKFEPSPGMPWFRALFLYRSNEVPAFNRADFMEYYWLAPQELLAKLDAGEPFKPGMPSAIRAVLPLL